MHSLPREASALLGKQVIIEQDGDAVIVTFEPGHTHKVENCNAFKLANTMWNKGTDHYTDEEMQEFGFEIKRRIRYAG